MDSFLDGERMLLGLTHVSDAALCLGSLMVGRTMIMHKAFMLLAETETCSPG